MARVQGSRIIDADMRFNENVALCPFPGTRIEKRRCTRGVVAGSNCFDLWALASHDTGHAHGLTHVGIRRRPSRLTMYERIAPFSPAFRTSGRGEIRGLRRLYPCQYP